MHRRIEVYRRIVDNLKEVELLCQLEEAIRGIPREALNQLGMDGKTAGDILDSLDHARARPIPPDPLTEHISFGIIAGRPRTLIEELETDFDKLERGEDY